MNIIRRKNRVKDRAYFCLRYEFSGNVCCVRKD